MTAQENADLKDQKSKNSKAIKQKVLLIYGIQANVLATKVK